MNRVIHFEIQADNVERAKDFYQKVFGWKIEKYIAKGDEEMMDYWLIMTGDKNEPGIDGGLYKRPADNKIYTYSCTINVADIDKAIESIKASGGIITMEKSKLSDVGWFAGAKDVEGNQFGLMQPIVKM